MTEDPSSNATQTRSNTGHPSGPDSAQRLQPSTFTESPLRLTPADCHPWCLSPNVQNSSISPDDPPHAFAFVLFRKFPLPSCSRPLPLLIPTSESGVDTTCCCSLSTSKSRRGRRSRTCLLRSSAAHHISRTFPLSHHLPPG